MKTYKNLASVIRSVVTEAHKKDDPPFEPDEKSSFKKANNKNRTGMDVARALARRAMQKKMKESFDLDISDEEADDLLEHILELDELSVATLSSYGNKAPKSISKMLDKASGHAEKATNLYAKGTASAVDKSFDHENRANDLNKKANNRNAGIDLAAKKLAKKFSKGE